MRRLWNFLTSLLRGERFRRAQAVLAVVADIIPYVESTISLLATLTRNRHLIAIQNALNYFRVPREIVPFDPERTYTKAEINGILMGAANFAVRNELQKSLEQALSGVLILGGQKFKSVSDIPDNIINTAVNTVYTIIKAEMEKENEQ